MVKVAAAPISNDKIAIAGFVDGAGGEIDNAMSAASDGHPVAQVDDRCAVDVVGPFAADVFGQPVFAGAVDRAAAMIEGADTEKAVISSACPRRDESAIAILIEGAAG